MSISNRIAGFSPKMNGFHFNDNQLRGEYPSLELPVIGTIYSGDASKGLCDGFVFAALDLFLHHPPLKPPPDTKPPSSNTRLFNYLTQRENDCWFSNNWSNFWKAFKWIHTSNHDTGFDTPFGRVVTGRGLAWLTVQEEWPRIKADIDAGRPSPLWLVTTPGCPVTNIPQTIKALTNHHQVLAYGYLLDDSKKLTLNIYDPEKHDSETETIVLNIANPEHTINISVSSYSWTTVRGFFRSYYELHDASQIAPHEGAETPFVALQTVNGHTLTIVNGGGLGGPNSGSQAVAIHTDATAAGPWETFTVECVDDSHIALKTVSGTYLTAVNGGGIGGPNDSRSPIHTDATWIGPWETLRWNYDAGTHKVTIQTPNGRYMTAVNGGGFGGPNTTPIHTDAKVRGSWETFKIVYINR